MSKKKRLRAEEQKRAREELLASRQVEREDRILDVLMVARAVGLSEDASIAGVLLAFLKFGDRHTVNFVAEIGGHCLYCAAPLQLGTAGTCWECTQCDLGFSRRVSSTAKPEQISAYALKLFEATYRAARGDAGDDTDRARRDGEDLLGFLLEQPSHLAAEGETGGEEAAAEHGVADLLNLGVGGEHVHEQAHERDDDDG